MINRGFINNTVAVSQSQKLLVAESARQFWNEQRYYVESFCHQGVTVRMKQYRCSAAGINDVWQKITVASKDNDL